MSHQLDEPVVVEKRTARGVGITDAEKPVETAELLHLASEYRVQGRAETVDVLSADSAVENGVTDRANALDVEGERIAILLAFSDAVCQGPSTFPALRYASMRSCQLMMRANRDESRSTSRG